MARYRQTLLTEWIRHQPTEQTSIPNDAINELPWPTNVQRIDHNLNPTHVQFEDIDVVDDKCGCTWTCDRLSCVNAIAAIYCETSNCSVGFRCGNWAADTVGLKIVRCSLNYGVVTSIDLPPNSIVGEYCGVIVRARNNHMLTQGYALKFKSTSDKREPIYVDAGTCGSISRFVNHACTANCRFEEMAYRRTRKIMLITEQHIEAGTQLTANYNSIWFKCQCIECNIKFI